MKLASVIASALIVALGLTARAADNTPPEGFTALFNGKDLTGWKGIPLRANAKGGVSALTMPQRLTGTSEELEKAQKLGDESAKEHWKAANGVLVFDGKGQNLSTA